MEVQRSQGIGFGMKFVSPSPKKDGVSEVLASEMTSLLKKSQFGDQFTCTMKKLTKGGIQVKIEYLLGKINGKDDFLLIDNFHANTNKAKQLGESINTRTQEKMKNIQIPELEPEMA